MLHLIADGNEAAFEQLFVNMYPALCFLAAKLGASPEAARDITADVFLYTWDNREQLTSVNNIRAYMYSAVRNRSLNYLKRSKVEKEYQAKAEIEQEASAGTSSILEAIYNTEVLRSMRAAIKTLPPECRQVVELVLTGLGTNEIAAQLQISPSAVSNQKARAIKLLRQKIAGPLLLLLLLQ